MMKTTTTQMPTMMEILAMAKSLLVDRYLEEKSRCVMRWQMLNDYGWSTNGEILVCPDMPEYPSPDEILALGLHIKQYFQESEITESQDSTAMYQEMVQPAEDHMPEAMPETMSEPMSESMPETVPVPVAIEMPAEPVMTMPEVAHAAVQQPAQPS